MQTLNKIFKFLCMSVAMVIVVGLIISAWPVFAILAIAVMAAYGFNIIIDFLADRGY